MQNYASGNSFAGISSNRFRNWTFIGITVFVVSVIMVGILVMVAWGWFRAGLPGPGVLEIALPAFGGGSVVALASLGFTLWRTHLAQRQIELNSRNSGYERFQRGIEMLGSHELFVRLGGIYALRALMKEHPEEFHVPAIELLCSFLRNPIDAGEVTRGSRIRQDIQTAVDVIVGRREAEVTLEKVRGFRLDLRNANLQYAELSTVNFSGANLERAIFSGTNMNGANLSEAVLDDADLSSANCRKSNLWKASLVRANMFHVSVDESDFSGANIDWVDCNGGSFYKTTFAKARIQNCTFKGALLHEANLTRTYISFGNMLTQQQLDDAVAEPDAPPFIYADLVDSETEDPLTWRGELPYHPSREEMQKRNEAARSYPGGGTLNLVSVNRINMKPPTKPEAGYF